MALDFGSSVSTPMNWIFEPLVRSASAVRANKGVSWRQGPHHEAKKLSTTGWWRDRPRESRLTLAPLVRDGSVKSGAVLPIPTTGPEFGPDSECGRRPTKRAAASTAAMPEPMRNERSRRGPGPGRDGGAAG